MSFDTMKLCKYTLIKKATPAFNIPNVKINSPEKVINNQQTTKKALDYNQLST